MPAVVRHGGRLPKHRNRKKTCWKKHGFPNLLHRKKIENLIDHHISGRAKS
jgi:hypothetical protein